MEEKLLLGKNVADSIKDRIKARVEELKLRGIEPALGILRVGDNPDDLAYQNGAVKTLESVGIRVDVHALSSDVKTQDVLEALDRLNNDNNTHGILMLRPLAKHLDEDLIRNAVLPSKDIDSMSDFSAFKPCTARAVIEILKFYKIDLVGKNAVVLGRSTVIGKPVALMLIDESATVTVCHSKTKNLKEVCKNADILVSAIGKAKFVNEDFVKPGAVVIDVGINFEDGKLVGDVDLDRVIDLVSAITPVPRGVGSVTTSVLAQNVIDTIKQ